MSNPNDNNANTSTNNNTPAADRQAEIEQRLAKLRADTARVVAQKDLEERLARLANRDPNYYSHSEPPIKIYQLIRKQQNMTDTEKADNLMRQLFSEMSIDEQCAKDGADIDAEIERRLALLRGQQQAQGQQGQQQQAALNFDAKPKGARELIAEILAQPDHDHEMASSDDDDGRSASGLEDDQEPEWCATCNEDGVLRCLDCDNDVYCRECFRDLHSDSDMRRHRTKPYQKSAPKAKGGSKSKSGKRF